LASLLDIAMGFLVWWAPGARHVATGELTVRYRRPVLLNTTVYVEAAVDRVEGRKRFLTSTLSEIADAASPHTADEQYADENFVDPAAIFVKGDSVYFQLDVNPATGGATSSSSSGVVAGSVKFQSRL
jgi:hypothetical protein